MTVQNTTWQSVWYVLNISVATCGYVLVEPFVPGHVWLCAGSCIPVASSNADSQYCNRKRSEQH